jgi:NAD(P)-dependent dehydrogenase (short-subunit alcohol dehydrogenase family)
MNRTFLKGKVCLVTGGAQGIGWAIAQVLADHGGEVHACDVSEDNLRRATRELAALPWSQRLRLTPCDVASRSALQTWIADVHRETGRIDVLVSNAAFVRWTNVDEMTIEEAERTIQVGYHAMLYGVKAVLPLMRAAGQGCIVNMGSAAGRIFVGGSSASYAAAKAAVDAFTQVLQIELQGTPIQAILVRPATVAGTDFFRKHVPFARLPRLADFLPCLTPPEVAAAVVRAIQKRRPTVDLPRYLSLLYLGHALVPGVLRWLFRLGGSGRRRYGEVQWQYRPRTKATRGPAVFRGLSD